MAGGYCVVGMQAFCMYHTQLEGRGPFHLSQRFMQAAGGIFAEHQVLSVGQGECLFVCAFHGCLNGGAQACLNLVDQLRDR